MLGLDLLTANGPNKWLVSIYFAATTITTIGYGDVTPQTAGEVALAVIFMCVAVSYFGYIISTVSSVLRNSGENSARNKAVMDKMQGVEAWMRRRHLPKQLKQQIRQFYIQSWSLTADDGEIQYFHDLPSSIRSNVAKIMMTATLEEGMFLHNDNLPPKLKTVAMVRIYFLSVFFFLYIKTTKITQMVYIAEYIDIVSSPTELRWRCTCLQRQ